MKVRGSYFIILLFVYYYLSFIHLNAQPWQTVPPPRGSFAEPKRGWWNESGEGGCGAQKNTLCFAEGWPAAVYSTGQQGALLCYLWTRQPSGSELQDKLCSFTQLQKEGEWGVKLLNPQQLFHLGYLPSVRQHTHVSLYLPTPLIVHPPLHQPLFTCIYEAHV